MKKLLMILVATLLFSCGEEATCPKIINPDIPNNSYNWIPIEVGNYWNYIGDVDYFKQHFSLPILQIDELKRIDTYRYDKKYLGKIYWYLIENNKAIMYDASDSFIIEDYYYDSKKIIIYGRRYYDFQSGMRILDDFHNFENIGKIDVQTFDSLFTDCDIYQYVYVNYNNESDTSRIYIKSGIGIVKLYEYEAYNNIKHECTLRDYKINR